MNCLTLSPARFTVALLLLTTATLEAFTVIPRSNNAGTLTQLRSTTSTITPPPSSSWFSAPPSDDSPVPSLSTLKAQILQLGAALDRGQAYNPTSGDYYNTTMIVARDKITQLVEEYGTSPLALEELAGEWELVLTTVKHGIFRSSPFFLAVQEAFGYAEESEAFGEDKAQLFFKLHELQTCSWGVSKIGRVAQRIDVNKSYIYSEFDTSIFSLTVIPILGWFKLLPTFGGCVVTASKCDLSDDGTLNMEVDYTTSRPVEGLSGLGEWIWSVKVPVGFIWKLLPWNKGRAATCSVQVVYIDEDFRVVRDKDGDLFVYTRPVVPRALSFD
mmetsp:Transcript_55502/g.66769  ORF Transcript_55502/g.66769 Transcript_55502/m.66769 type:complete len:329 (+) Transcript_55502:46-1032(+)